MRSSADGNNLVYNVLGMSSEHAGSLEVERAPKLPDTQPHLSDGLSAIEYERHYDPLKLRIVCAVLSCANVADAVETICVGYIMAELGNNLNASEKGLLSAIVFVGMLVGSFSVGFLADRYGRKKMLLVALAINGIAGWVSVFAPTVRILIASRFFAGIGIGGSLPAIFTLSSELFPVNVRGRYVSIVSGSFMFGAIFAALVAWIMLGDNYYGNRIIPGVSWRVFAAVCTIPVLLTLTGLCMFVPESPRFLINVGRLDLAKESIAKLSLNSFKADLQLPVHETGHVPQSSSLRLLIYDMGTVTFKLTVIWFTLAFGSYGILIWAATLFYDIGIVNPYASAFVFVLGELPGNIISIMLVDAVERKRILVIGLLIGAGSALGFGVGVDYPGIVVLSAVVFSGMSSLVWNTLQLMTAEYFPSHARGLAMGSIACFGRIGAIAAQFINASLENNVPLLLFVTSSCCIVGSIASFVLPVKERELNNVSSQPASACQESHHEPNHVSNGSSFVIVGEEDDVNADDSKNDEIDL